jgi:hypothetical protein
MSNKSPWIQTFAGQPVLGSHAQWRCTATTRDVEMFIGMTVANVLNTQSLAPSQL